MVWITFIGALIGFGYSLWVNNAIGISTCALVIGGALLLKNIDKLESFKAGKDGFEAKTKQLDKLIDEATAKLSDLQNLAKVLGNHAIGSIQMAGRMSGFTKEQKETYKEQILTTLRAVGIEDTDIFEILEQSWHPMIEFDYSIYSLNGNTVPKEFADLSPAIREWKKLRDQGIKGRPSPDEVQSFWEKHNALTQSRQQIIDDYRYYINNRQHRDPELFESRYAELLKTS